MADPMGVFTDLLKMLGHSEEEAGKLAPKAKPPAPTPDPIAGALKAGEGPKSAPIVPQPPPVPAGAPQALQTAKPVPYTQQVTDQAAKGIGMATPQMPKPPEPPSADE